MLFRSTSANVETPQRRHPTAASQAHIARVPRLDNISALVVDDDPETREALRSLLISLGAKVKTAGNVENAITLLDQTKPDLLISDIGMPGHDGYWLIREIRASEKATAATDHLPAVALTAYGRVEDRVAVLASGFDAHVVKPVDPAELAAVIKRLVEARRSGIDQPLPGQDTKLDT